MHSIEQLIDLDGRVDAKNFTHFGALKNAYRAPDNIIGLRVFALEKLLEFDEKRDIQGAILVDILQYREHDTFHFVDKATAGVTRLLIPHGARSDAIDQPPS